MQAAKLGGSWQWALRVTPVLGAIFVGLAAIFVREPKRGEAEKALAAKQETQLPMVPLLELHPVDDLGHPAQLAESLDSASGQLIAPIERGQMDKCKHAGQMDKGKQDRCASSQGQADGAAQDSRPLVEHAAPNRTSFLEDILLLLRTYATCYS